MAEPDELEKPKELDEEALEDQDVPQTPQPSADEDPETDKAVEDITRSEADHALETQDSEAAVESVIAKQGRWVRFKRRWVAWWASPRNRLSAVVAAVIIVGMLFAAPFTRYNILGLVLRAPVTVTVVDSKSGESVSGAEVTLGGAHAETNANGRATLHAHAGSKALQVSKKYYRGSGHRVLVTLSAGSNSFRASLVATGRQVKVKLVNKISGKPVANAAIKTGGATAKTNKNGLATVVLPSGATTQAASITLATYNTADVQIAATSDLAKNTFTITPAGKLYFLSNLSGTIDVVKTNLDGTDRQTVLAGTGSEDRSSTSLLASRDWKYLALLAKRSGSNASLYLIDTTNGDKLSTIDEGNADFTLVGWSGDRFVYQVNRKDVADWQPHQQALKSFDPTTGHALLLDQSQGAGSDTGNYAKQVFSSTYLIGSQVIYVKNWAGNTPFGAQNVLSSKQAELDNINSDGSSHRVVKTFVPSTPPSGYGFSSTVVTAQLYEPSGLYLWFLDGSQNNFYDYEDGKVAADTTLTADTFYATPYPTFLLSPSGNQTFWADQRDGKNTLFTGNDDAKNQRQIASLSDYNTYGWYTDNYLLVSKNSSELSIMPVAGGTPLKISDYYKPAVNYNGYGGGYGGL